MRDPNVYLYDMLQACASVASFVSGADLARYQHDDMLRSAVERKLQNIGEALSQLSKLDEPLAAKVPRHRQLIGFRNVLVHGYAGLSDDEVWRLTHENLPELAAALTALLNQLDPNFNP